MKRTEREKTYPDNIASAQKQYMQSLGWKAFEIPYKWYIQVSPSNWDKLGGLANKSCTTNVLRIKKIKYLNINVYDYKLP